MPKNWNRVPTNLVPPGTMVACASTADYYRELVKRIA